MRYFLTAGLLVALTSCATTERSAPELTAKTPQPSDILQRIVVEARQGSLAPALAAAVVTCSADAAAADGKRAADEAALVSRNDRFNIGSNAKSMLATLVAILAESGELRWDSTVEQLFGEEAKGIHPELRRVTVEDLLAHRAGLAAYTSGAELDGITVSPGDAMSQRRSFATAVLATAPATTPGTEFVYSNAGYVVVGAALERLTGMPFEQIMQKRLFDPLGITASFGEPATVYGDQPRGHFVRGGTHHVYRSEEPVIPVFLQPAGDVALSPKDYGKYLQLHLCGLQGKDTPLLQAKTIAFLHAPRGEEGASLGWGRYEFDGIPASIHIGGTGAFSAYVAVLPDRDLALATMVNSGAPEAGKTALSLLNSLIKEPIL